ncbi:MAG: cysteine--tRNA ligase [Anaeromusa sp.]|uniref:cysteine--tRNA ligase n=1 Tax=Anaeromusa sp. TaxID=1872520 RepID=UPI002B21D6F0|nr:cysteine--tRNA ligase [Anaeromusa sp.]MEA4834645.1 cysteine--tRNA ligase [Anaeromusa sp.]
MNLRVYNTLTKQKEAFVPLEEGKVKMYVCGVTPYNHPHIGNARPFVTWDVIRRYLEQQGWEVMHVQNFTDVDDKIIRTANEEQVPWHAISERYIASYFEVMDKLNVRRAAIYPKVSTHMQEIIDMVTKLVKDGFAYVVDGDVYYAVEKFADYGKLSGRSLDDMKAGARVEVDERKNHPMDFALWKSAKPGEPSWESPWGAGRPGWHIECSAMSHKYLGEQFDFHGGGSDLIFPHHENEVAQSEAFTGVTPFVRYWLHNGFITVNQEKMSKSLGNFFLVQDILAHYAPEVLRFFILSTHYRSPLDFSDERLTEAERALERLATVKRNLAELAAAAATDCGGAGAEQLLAAAQKASEEFYAAMDDDFNTALAISTFFTFGKEVNSYQALVASGKEAASVKAVNEAVALFALLEDVLGIVPAATESAAEDNGLVDGLMELVLELRQQARQNKDWGTADRIRDALQALEVVIEDSPQGTRWKRK